VSPRCPEMRGYNNAAKSQHVAYRQLLGMAAVPSDTSRGSREEGSGGAAGAGQGTCHQLYSYAHQQCSRAAWVTARFLAAAPRRARGRDNRHRETRATTYDVRPARSARPGHPSCNHGRRHQRGPGLGGLTRNVLASGPSSPRTRLAGLVSSAQGLRHPHPAQPGCWRADQPLSARHQRRFAGVVWQRPACGLMPMSETRSRPTSCSQARGEKERVVHCQEGGAHARRDSRGRRSSRPARSGTGPRRT